MRGWMMLGLMTAQLFLVIGCGGQIGSDSFGRGGEDKKTPAAQRLLYSLNGEPLGRYDPARCGDMLGEWGARIDRSQSGSITLDDLLEDARAQFARMDLDHTGYVTAESLGRYRQPFYMAAFPDKQSETGQMRRNGPSLDADPVMSADRDLDFKVTLGEFLTQARETFAQMDQAKRGKLTLDQIKAQCASASSARK